MADESSSCEGLFTFYEKSKTALAMKSVLFGFEGKDMISKFALNQRMSHLLIVLYAVTLVVYRDFGQKDHANSHIYCILQDFSPRCVSISYRFGGNFYLDTCIHVPTFLKF